MLEYFQRNENLRIEAISEQEIVQRDLELARALDDAGELIEIPVETAFITQNDETKDIFFILSGICDVVVNGRLLATRGPRNSVGEMAVIQPTQRRSATCIAKENIIALKVSGESFRKVSDAFPKIFYPIAQELARRLLERNTTLPGHRDSIRIFIICSVESLGIAREIQTAFEYDPFQVVIWTDGVFRVSSYPIEALESEIENSDFAVAIAHGDDRTTSRRIEWPSPRDNVIFELGLFLGRLGRSRAILMEPREEKVKLPSDMSGITTIAYSFPKDGKDVAAAMGPACNKLRGHVQALGPFNG